MKKAIFMLAAAAALFVLPSCKKVIGDGPVQSEIRTISDFSGVKSSIAGKINYTIGPVFKVELIAQSNILDVLETSKDNGHLLIKVRNGVRIKNNEDIVVNISAPAADYLHLSGSGDLYVSGEINSANVDLDISGSGNIVVSNVIVTNNLKANISGSGGISVQTGKAKSEDLNISGSGHLTLDGVAAENVKARISGSGNLRVNASQSLDATISGSGSVLYLGHPLVSTNISGSGKVRPL
jgi:Putative auto-transporter adhesin, head GIN domain